MMKIAPSTECEACKTQIGDENYVVCWDGINSKTTVFHSRCNPTDPHLRREHHIGLAPLNFSYTPKEIET